MAASLLGQVGWKSEVTWGTAVTVDTFHPGWISGNPVREQPPLVSRGIRAGRRVAACLSTGPKTVSGPMTFELYNQPMATLLRHMFGTIATTGVGPYTHTASPGSLNGKSMTVQVGIPSSDGTVRAFTYSGAKIPSWTLSASSGEIATLETEISAKDYVTATALATASYPTDCPFTFIHGSVSVAGVSQGTVDSFSLSSTRPLRVKHPVGSSTIIEQLEEGPAEYEISVTADFQNLTIHDLANTGVAVVLAFSDGTDSLTITTNAWVNPMTPGVDGPDSLPSFEFTATPYHSTSDASAITAVLVNGEATSA